MYRNMSRRQCHNFNIRFVKSRARQASSRALGVFSFVLAILASSSLIAQSEEVEFSTTFLIVRHAEREGDLDKLTEAGLERAQLLASIGKSLNVEAIYSTDTDRTKGTAQPLASAIDKEIHIYERPSKEWIASLKEKHVGQVVLIVGHSNTAGVIAGLLANKESFEIAHDEYDALFIIETAFADSNCVRIKYGPSSAGAPSAARDKMGLDKSN